MLTRAPVLILAAAGLAGCSASPASAPAKSDDTGQRARQQAIAAESEAENQLLGKTRIDVLEARIAALEKEVGEMQASRAHLNDEVVSQRLGALEARLATSDPASASAPTAPAPGADDAAKPTAARLIAPHPKASPTPRLTIKVPD